MNKKKGVKTLGQFIIEKLADFPFSKGELSRLLRDIGIASKIVHREVNKAGVVDILGNAGSTNVQGEEVKKLDLFANEQFISALSSGGECCAIASEENEDIIPIDNDISKNAKYVVAIDPLDGSSNIDVNVSIGTLFSIYRRVTLSGRGTIEDFMQRGTEQVAAGIQDTLNLYTVGASRYFRFSQVAGYIPGAQYDVRVRPYFPYDYDAPFGPSVCLRVAGTSSFFSITNNFGDESVVELEKEPTFSASLYPNPNDGNQIAVLIDSEEEREFIITIYDGLGRLVHNEKVMVSGELNYNLNQTNTFADGVYTVNFYSNGDVQTQRMIVKNK